MIRSPLLPTMLSHLEPFDEDLYFGSSPILSNPVLSLRSKLERLLTDEHELPPLLNRFEDRLINGDWQ